MFTSRPMMRLASSSALSANGGFFMSDTKKPYHDDEGNPWEPSLEVQERLLLYRDLMNEIKSRINVVNSSYTPMMSSLFHPGIIWEFCFLQMRFMCEMIAVAVLIAHGDIKATKTSHVQKFNEPGAIMGILSKVHPKFYPRPYTRHPHKDDPDRERVEPITSGYPTQTDLPRLFARCGSVLHFGTAKTVLAWKPRDVD